MKQSIRDFLLRRLQEVGIRRIFGVPGDYNLELLQQIQGRPDPGGCLYIFQERIVVPLSAVLL